MRHDRSRSWFLLVTVLAVATPGGALAQTGPAVVQRYERHRASRDELDRTVWARERAAVEYEQYFVNLWDDIRASTPRELPLREAAFGSLRLGSTQLKLLGSDGRWEDPVMLEMPGPLDPEGFGALLDDLVASGFRLEQCEWHHDDFRVADDGRAVSTVLMILHVDNPAQGARYQLDGTLRVEWSTGSEVPHVPDLIEVTRLSITQWNGPPVFQERFTVSLPHASPLDDVLVYDVNGDGLSDFVYPSSNQLFINEGGFKFRADTLCAEAPRVIMESVFADFTGDGVVDYLCAGASPTTFTPQTRMRLFLYTGDPTGRDGGRFTSPPRRLGPRELQFARPDCFAVGDVDGDGDLDVWVTQYLAPYLNGQFPAPYYDANDGLPSFLLLNDSTGNLTDATEGSGLAEKRFRRTFRSSFVDLDEDGDLDLVVVSDFAGVDVYENDGTGHFTDVTASRLDDPSSFGMSHTFGDFDTDGRVDLYVTGMGSTTARRLDRMGLGRTDLAGFDEMRPRIGYGNRMYLAQGTGRYLQPPFRDDVARSGWAWGCTTLDFDSDGDPEIYVSNGNQSGRSVQDYCTRFWCHDVYTGSVRSDPALARLFAEDMKPLRTGLISWNGYEHNHFFLNNGDDGFDNVAYLMGLALEADCRATVADDFDLDGRPDLLVVAFDRRSRYPRRVVTIFQNTWTSPRHWIGVRLTGGPGVSPIGARVLVVRPGGRQADVFVTGDSAKAQHAHLKHFGLGADEAVEFLEVRWPNGTVQRLEHPGIDRYHDLTPPGS